MQQEHQYQQHQNEPAPQPAPAPAIPGTSKKFMSLEEVEAQILAKSQKSPLVQPPPQKQQQQQHHRQSQVPPNQPIHQFQHQLPQHTPSPSHQAPQYVPPPVDLRGFPQHQLPPHMQQIMHQTQQPAQLHQMHTDRAIGRQSPVQMPPIPPMPPMPPMQPQRVPPRDQEPVGLSQGRNQFGMVTHMSAQQLHTMSEADRLRYLEEESKRLKRNHKIALLVCDESAIPAV